jgi:mRNA interferase RelE/StbE
LFVATAQSQPYRGKPLVIIANPSYARAAKSLDRISEPFRSQIADALHNYATGKPSDTKAMTGTPTVRLRVGDYRIVFDETATEIRVLVLGHRREIYR